MANATDSRKSTPVTYSLFDRRVSKSTDALTRFGKKRETAQEQDTGRRRSSSLSTDLSSNNIGKKTALVMRIKGIVQKVSDGRLLKLNMKHLQCLLGCRKFGIRVNDWDQLLTANKVFAARGETVPVEFSVFSVEHNVELLSVEMNGKEIAFYTRGSDIRVFYVTFGKNEKAKGIPIGTNERLIGKVKHPYLHTRVFSLTTPLDSDDWKFVNVYNDISADKSLKAKPPPLVIQTILKADGLLQSVYREHCYAVKNSSDCTIAKIRPGKRPSLLKHLFSDDRTLVRYKFIRGSITTDEEVVATLAVAMLLMIRKYPCNTLWQMRQGRSVE